MLKQLTLVALFSLLIVVPAQAKPQGEDKFDPALVEQYIFLSCEALKYSYDYMLEDLTRIESAYNRCTAAQDATQATDPYYGLQCVYIQQYWDLRFTHLESVKQAAVLLCLEDGSRAPQYEITY